MKVGFITDTNIIKLNEGELADDTNFLIKTQFFLDYIDSLNNTNFKSKLHYIMPNIILDELYYQKLSKFNEKYKSLEKNYKDINFGLNGKIPKNNCKEVLNKQKEKEIKRFHIINPLLTVSSFKKTLDDALKKKPPFDKTKEGKKTDSGFKDYMIWNTILHANLEDFSELYFFSGDDIFDDNKIALENDFNKKHEKTKLKIIKVDSSDKNKIKNCLNIIIQEHHFPQTDIIKLYDSELLLSHIKTINYELDKDICYYLSDNRKLELKSICFNAFDTTDFNVDTIDKNGEYYYLILSFSTLKYTSNLDNEDMDKKKINGKIRFVFQSNNNTFEIKDSKIEKVSFNIFPSKLSDLSVFYNTICHETLNDSLQMLKEAFTALTFEDMHKKLSMAEALRQGLEKISDSRDRASKAINSSIFKANNDNKGNN